ncbi:hypothetical protein H6G89_05305 [Oscillatoria sp. FACHB-1407]|uniref:hypothetical protein n=1 Tax=Oscillatoria sp. FACHB-1407 TaxID=2692847 RepID=UPI0016854E42|nr:hypothetical protein [Oscillatoria sp. FACHB-1407]MBD2460456.1 hypothetical protein [Oscillatoria sp. FACHB-1407]
MVDGQWLVVRSQEPGIRRQWLMVNGQWLMVNSQWSIVSGYHPTCLILHPCP